VATAAGQELRRRIEAMTDDLAAPAFAGLTDEEMAARALLGCATQIQGSGVLPFPNPIGLPALKVQ
jgi:DNA-binding MarR family transcriptional regulator